MASRFVAFLVALSFACTLLAQSNGSLTGTVKDTRGGVVPGAQVTASSDASGVRQTNKTNDAGIFVFPELPPGTYSVTAEMQGFKKTVRNEVIVPVASKINLGD